MLLHKKARDPLQRKPQGPVPRSATVDLVFRTCLTEHGSAFADRGPWAMFLGNGSRLRGIDHDWGVTAPNPHVPRTTANRPGPLHGGARSTLRGLRVGAVVSFEGSFVCSADPRIAGHAARLLRCVPRSGVTWPDSQTSNCKAQKGPRITGHANQTLGFTVGVVNSSGISVVADQERHL